MTPRRAPQHTVFMLRIVPILAPLPNVTSRIDGLGTATATGAVGCADGCTATSGVGGAFSSTVGIGGLGVTATIGAG
jgi:hypothetical protein